MAKGLHKHQAYRGALQLLGKSLMRRSKKRCELSGESGELVIYDLKDPRAEPTLDEVIHISPEMKSRLDGARFNADEVRCLETAVWSEHPAVREATIRLLERVDEPWAREALESAQMMSMSDTSDH